MKKEGFVMKGVWEKKLAYVKSVRLFLMQDSLTPMYLLLRMTAEHKNAVLSNPFASWMAACAPYGTRKGEILKEKKTSKDCRLSRGLSSEETSRR